MAWGLEFISNLNPFSFGVIGIIISFTFLFAFSYIAIRNKPNAVENTVEVLGYSLLIGGVLFLIGLPPLLLGVGYIVGYLLVVKHFAKMKFDLKFFIFVFYMLFVFGVFAVLDDFSRLWFTIFAIALLFVISEIDLKQKPAEAVKK